MADSDLYMQCDEDDLEPCQNFTEKGVPLLNNATTITLLPNVINSGGRAASGPQTFVISTQPSTSKPLGGPLKLGPPVGYFLNGQPVSFVPAGQTPQLAAAQAVTSATSGNQMTPAKITQIPVTLTLNSPTSPTAPGATTLNVMPSSILPASAPGSTIKVIKVTKYPGTPGTVGSELQPSIPVPIKSNKVYRTLAPGPAPVMKPQVLSFLPASPSTTGALSQTSSSPNFCPHCKAIYQKSAILRGYFCQCDKELIKNIWSLKSLYRRNRKKRHPKPTNIGSEVSTSLSSEKSLTNITLCELPEGAPNPSSGDFDDQGRLIMLVEDFFYGECPGQPPSKVESISGPLSMKCPRCSKKLKDNVKMMNHMKHHLELDWQTGEVDNLTICSHCYRTFQTPFQLQCHIDAVHSKEVSSKVCKICESSFESEPLFLDHMKRVHKPGEMPYWCKVCDYRSSFYQDVMDHFKEKHHNTATLMCIFCLKIFRSFIGFQMHMDRHQERAARHCDKCRLQFCLQNEVMNHQERFHKTWVKPKQLEGLVPGTRIIIRAYADKADLKDPVEESSAKMSSKTTQTSTEPQSTTVPPPLKKKPVESMVQLIFKQNPNKKHYCMECNFDIPEFSNHFPTFVKCSLCRYCTCCCRAYANHMISVHVPRNSTRKYITLYKPCPKKGLLSCTGCSFSTQIGDLMAKHLADFPDHQACRSTMQDGFSRGFKRFVFIPTKLLNGGHRQLKGGFLPVRVKQVDKCLVPLSPKPLPKPSYTITLPEKPARVPSFPMLHQPFEKYPTPQKKQASKPSDANKTKALKNIVTPLQLKIVLHALLYGVPQAADHFSVPPDEVHKMLLKRQSLHKPTTTREVLIAFTRDSLIEWVLCQREQQLPVTQSDMFDYMSRHSGRAVSNDMVIDFLLRYDLGSQAFTTSTKLPLLKSQELEQLFSICLKNQIASQSFELSSIGAMDELSIFVDLDKLNKPAVDAPSMLSAFSLMGTTDPVIDVMFSALADGTLLSTILFLKGDLLKIESRSLPDFIILEACTEGFSNEERLKIWLQKVWLKKIFPGCGGKGLLIMDSYKGHVSDEFLALLNSANTVPGLIPQSCSRRLQPLDICMGRVLREYLQARWSEHVSRAPKELLGVKPESLAVLLSQWLNEILGVLRGEPKILFRSFDRVLISNPEQTSEEPSELVRSFTDAILLSKLQAEEQKTETSSVVSAESCPSSQSDMLALKKIFERDSDVETFHGFEES